MKIVLILLFHFLIIISTTKPKKSFLKQDNETLHKNQTFSINNTNNNIRKNKRFINPHDFFQTFTPRCKDKCFKDGGKCLSNNTICKCNFGYINHPFNSTYFCSYKQKSQLNAFLLEVFTFVGGDMYLGFYIYGLIKLAVMVSIIIGFYLNLPCQLCGIRILMEKDCVPCSCIRTGSVFVSFIIMMVWSMSDISVILNDDAKDVLDVPLIYMFN